MAVVDFDLRFTYVLVGWEGTAHVALVLHDALERENGLRVPQGKFYLVDTGYGAKPGFLPPFCGVRAINEKFNTRITGEQVKNYLKTWQKRIAKINRLKKLSAALFDEEKCIITLDEEHYNGHVHDHKFDAEFLNKPLLHYREMEAIFGNSMATGNFAKDSSAPLGRKDDEGESQEEGDECPHRPFHSLVRSILYQQLAFKAAASVYSRFLSLLGGEASVTPDAVLALTPQQLRQIGVSPRKASYLHDLARKYVSGILSDSAIINMDDRSLAAMLTMVKGIGAWSVHMFMIFSLARPDVLPSADLGVRKGVQMLHGLEDVPRPSQMDKLCERWRPYRSVGAWYMWRLIESKVPQPAPAIPVGPLALPSPDGQIMLQQQQQQQQSVIQMIDPLQMLPGMG
ncbi:uncharacterized protein LOC101783346 [Setaria italica]|nr:uncharacterized protein LOC101783346 [Setaria italica]